MPSPQFTCAFTILPVAEQRFDTNVRISKPALDRLSEIAYCLGRKSRDHTARYLLLKYIEKNGGVPADDRLTHISTVMRHPLPPREWDEDPVPVRRVRLRLPAGASDKARSLAFRVPGQAKSRGHADYQSRLLTDALMTSIAEECCELGLSPITDSALQDVRPLIRHRAARGLWQLAVNATRTDVEKDVLTEAAESREEREQLAARTGDPIEDDRYVDKLAAVLLQTTNPDDGEAVWHREDRFRLVQFIASEILSTAAGNDTDLIERALYNQCGQEWEELVADTVNLSPKRRRKGRPSNKELALAHENNVLREWRGGAAKWRAQRILALPRIVEWLAQSAKSKADRTFEVDPPGWRLVLPDSWNPTFHPPGPLPGNWAEHVAQQRVLHFDLGDTQMLWPTVDAPHGDPNVSRPVAGLQRALASLLDRKGDARQVVEIVLLELISRHNSESADQARTTNRDGRTASSSAAGTAIPPGGKRPNKALDELLLGEDGEQPFPGSDDETDNDLRLASDDPDVLLPVYVPAETAYKLNFIDRAHAKKLTDQAKSITLDRMRRALAEARRNKEPSQHGALEKAMNNPAQFAKLARKLNIRFHVEHAVWRWHVTSFSTEITAKTTRDQVRWLAASLSATHTLELERKMESAGRAAVAQYYDRTRY